jgi:LacI family transcriptional regulator
MQELIEWLNSLPQPIAILACDDEQAHLVLDVALTLGLRVPEDAAVMGIDNDEVFCCVSNPPLSSVDVNAVAVGYKAAEVLAKRMKGRRIDPGRRRSRGRRLFLLRIPDGENPDSRFPL